jgi:hypothetical protein
MHNIPEGQRFNLHGYGSQKSHVLGLCYPDFMKARKSHEELFWKRFTDMTAATDGRVFVAVF